MKLSKSQIKGLKFLGQPWCAKWWGGKPHAGWPSDLNGRTYDALAVRRLVTKVRGPRAFEEIITLTPLGLKELEAFK